VVAAAASCTQDRTLGELLQHTVGPGNAAEGSACQQLLLLEVASPAGASAGQTAVPCCGLTLGASPCCPLGEAARPCLLTLQEEAHEKQEQTM
jgi:hypothetical protein